MGTPLALSKYHIPTWTLWVLFPPSLRRCGLSSSTKTRQPGSPGALKKSGQRVPNCGYFGYIGTNCGYFGYIGTN